VQSALELCHRTRLTHMVEGSGSDRQRRVTGLGVASLILAILALAAPLSAAESPAARVGWLLAFAASIEGLHALRRTTSAARRQATIGAVISAAIALLLINAPLVAAEALRYLVAGWFAIDAFRYAVRALREATRAERGLAVAAALGNTACLLVLLLARGWVLTWVVAIAGALRICGIAWNIMVAPVHTTAEADETVLDELGVADQPRAAEMVAEVSASERARAPIDRGWTLAFVATLFAIHAGRMSIDRTLLGLVSPAVAVLGDMLIAVAITLVIVNPMLLLWRGPTRWLERWIWRWYLGTPAGARWSQRLANAWLRLRISQALRMRAGRYSIPAALNRGLQTGLPLAAVLAATVPVWGMSWYFDTENWAAGMWNSWAETRTDTWREAMVRAVLALDGGTPHGTNVAHAETSEMFAGDADIL
jgi:uncharacterized membrane protein HdeD (DUF308 family)